MNDPLSPLLVPPPRYLLESDSSDEQGQGAYPGPSSKPKIRTDQTAQVQVDPALQGGQEVILGLGQAGRYVHRLLKGEAANVVRINGKVVGRAKDAQGTKVVALEDAGLDGETVWELVRTLNDKLKPKKWTIFTSYVPSMYIPSPSEHGEKLRQSPPVRVFSNTNETVTEGVAGFDAPNYLSGVAGGLVSLAAHPSSTRSVTTLLLPLPLSALPSSALRALSTLCPSLANLVHGYKWTEDDDEPYAAPGMGRKLATTAGETMGMYT